MRQVLTQVNTDSDDTMLAAYWRGATSGLSPAEAAQAVGVSHDTAERAFRRLKEGKPVRLIAETRRALLLFRRVREEGGVTLLREYQAELAIRAAQFFDRVVDQALEKARDAMKGEPTSNEQASAKGDRRPVTGGAPARKATAK